MEALSCNELTDLSRGLAHAYTIGYANSDAHHHRESELWIKSLDC